jgi:hypothetical protein
VKLFGFRILKVKALWLNFEKACQKFGIIYEKFGEQNCSNMQNANSNHFCEKVKVYKQFQECSDFSQTFLPIHRELFCFRNCWNFHFLSLHFSPALQNNVNVWFVTTTVTTTTTTTTSTFVWPHATWTALFTKEGKFKRNGKRKEKSVNSQWFKCFFLYEVTY